LPVLYQLNNINISTRMPDPTDPIFLPRLNINRSSSCTEDLGWLGLDGGHGGHGGCDTGWGPATDDCDTRDDKCSFYYPCDNKSSDTANETKHSYYDCCVKVSANKLLDHWLNDHQDTGTTSTDENKNHQEDVESPSFIDVNCQNESSLSSLLLPNQEDESQNILHLVLRRPSRVRNLIELVKYIVDKSKDEDAIVNAADNHGDTPLTLVRNLLEENRFDEAKEVAELLLDKGANPNHKNECGWTILSYSLVHQDNSLSLTRSLLHHGSSVISQDVPPSLTDQNCLPLRVLLRSVIRSQSVTNARETLHILGQVLSCQNPTKMKDHVLSSIVAEGSLLTGNGPDICTQVHSMLAAYWSQPKPLLHLSLQASRKRLGLKRLTSGNLKPLLIAPRIQNYLSYQSTLPIFYSPTQTTGTNKTDSNKNLSQFRHETLSDKIKIRLQCTAAYKRK